ncbi:MULTISPECIES: 4Fe-4S binding protein [unclassified Dehalobacter]|uniref:4Fe-4S binding protein n=1 Tax=unclassified Dehalobacter TaxID=2635733 RepID=UPI000E6CE3E7|nr:MULTISPECIES: 4Fe-4S binding protein [unclassified Dehalobacter]RJE49170.1 4Fe-4S ferredoxin [Dehalobacter sp. MCB1]TCX53210.1 4Fe-4S ferredoxin [Dehalobacter sp. 14DCB1]TCX54224.1 4Fe-4S ferredoxin [Dehalobacter sp. 12DCB1]
MKSNKIAKWLRIVVLVGLLAWITVEGYLHQALGAAKAASVHALCPFGALESLYTILFAGSYIKKIFSGTVVLLVLTVILAVIFRRSFCGLLCPFGALQELFARLGKKIFKKRYTIPLFIDKPLRYLKYVILVLTLVMAWYTGTLWMSPYDPYSAYSHLMVVSQTIQEDAAAIVGFILLFITLLGSLLYDRFFCKYLCPAGAFYAFIGKISPTRIERDNQICINCKACNKACPINIDVAKADKVTSAECLNCNECILACPKKGALEVKIAKRKVHPLAALIMVIVLFFGTIAVAEATGNYQVTSAPPKGQTVSLIEVKGSYTIEDTAKATGLSLAETYELLGIPQEVNKNTKLKDISKVVPEFNLEEVKEK